MNWLVRGLRTTVGLKFLMAFTGILLFLFAVGHMVGNLQIFLGPDALNGYAASLHRMPGLLWVVRGGLLTIVMVHILCALCLTRRNWAARPTPYAVRTPIDSTCASRTMLMTGLVILAFVVYHLLHFTFGVVQPDVYDRRDVYSMVVTGFRQPVISASYVAAMVLLFLHLRHGVASLFQSLGWNRPKYVGFTRVLGEAFALVILVGNVLIPLACLAGLVTLPQGAD